MNRVKRNIFSAKVQHFLNEQSLLYAYVILIIGTRREPFFRKRTASMVEWSDELHK